MGLLLTQGLRRTWDTWSWNHIQGAFEWHTVQSGFVPKALESHGDLGEMAYAARLELALRGRDGIGKTM